MPALDSKSKEYLLERGCPKMKNWWRLLVFSGLIGLAVCDLAAQKGAYLEAVPSGEVVRLRWLTGEPANTTYVVERGVAGTGEFQPVNQTPIQAVWSLERWQGAFGAFFPQAVSVLGEDQSTQFLRRLQERSADRLALGITSIEACELMGWYYVDQTVRVGEKYDYRLVKVSGNQRQVLATVEGITAGDPPTQPVPPKPTIKVQNAQVLIQWTFPNDPRLHGVFVERSERAEGPFERIRPFISVNSFWFQKIARSQETVKGETVVLDVPPQQNKQYFYRLVSVDFVGNRGPVSEVVSFQVPYLEPPQPPTNVSGEVTPDGKIILRWEASPSPQVVGYRIYQGTALGDDAKDLLTPQTLSKESLSFTVEKQDAGTMLWYAVVSVDPFDAESQRTAGVAIKFPDVTAPSTPKGLKIQLIEEQTGKTPSRKLVLTWNTNEDPDLLGYHIARSSQKEGPYSIITNEPLKETKYEMLLKPLEEGTLYFRLYAIDFDQNLSLPSPEEAYRLPNVQPPDAPVITSVIAEGNLQLIISWKGSVAQDVAGYLIERRLDNGDWELLNDGKPLPKTPTQFTDKNLLGGRLYEYRLTAVDEGGLKSQVSELMGGIPRDTEPPAPPSTLTARLEPGIGAVLLVWEPSASKDVAKYLLYRALGEKGEFLPLGTDIDPNTTQFADYDVSPDVTYRYQIVAVDYAGNVSPPTVSRTIKVPK